MNLTDDHLRDALRGRAERLAPPVDVFASVEKRARTIRRNRRGVAILGAAAAVAAVAVIVPTVVGGSGHQGVPVGPAPTSTTQPTPTQTTGPTPTTGPTTAPSETPVAQGVLDPSHPWAYRGAATVAAGSTLASFTAAWQAKHPGTTLTPLYGEVYEPSAQPEMVFVSTGHGGPRWGYATGSHDGVRILVDEPLPSGALVLAAAAPGDEVSRLLAVAAPTTKVIRYAPDGQSFGNITMIAPGVGVFPLEGDPAVDRIQVVGAGGAVVYTGPAPDVPVSTG